MRIAYIRASGFRGIKGEINISLPKGFTVITGRNGSGKSTICNAIEYALTGTLQDHSSITEKGEKIADYLWWRGDKSAKEYFVSVGFVNDQGETFEITRRPEQELKEDVTASIEGMICNPSTANDSISELCRTTFIRDETITKFSLDIPEVDRFNFVKSAIGVSDFNSLESKTKEIAELLKKRLARLETEYQKTRFQVQDTIASLSEANAQILKSEDIVKAEISLREYLNSSSLEISELISLARKTAADVRTQVDGLSRVLRTVVILDKRREEIETRAFIENRERLENRVSNFSAKLWYEEQNLADLDERLNALQKEAPHSSRVAQLHELGRHVGLRDGKCPLCGCEVNQDKFEVHTSETLKEIALQSQALAAVIKERTSSLETVDKLRHHIEAQSRELSTLSGASTAINDERERVFNELSQLGVAINSQEDLNADYISRQLEERRHFLSILDKNLAVLDTSSMLDRVVELRRKLAGVQEKAYSVETQISKVKSAVDRVKNAATLIKRVSGEIVDEQLAALSPLFGELYFRLRPHVDWPEVSYHIRGDVRRFLSLRVGDDINPRFVFSSGQRRAAGLAFLLAVHLSRSWCNLHSLILDDPVQHIDDFRALHLVEVLAGIRQCGQQVICTVQDSALADLLCRRLRSNEYKDGCLIEMEYAAGEGVKVGNMRDIHPFPSEVLLSA